MAHPEHKHSHEHSHSHDKGCCDHDHGHEHHHAHDHNPLKLSHRWVISILSITVLLMLLKPFIISQMLVRVTSYSANSSYSQAVRMCKKIIDIDQDNKQAWVSLGYAYMDLSQTNQAIVAFNQVLLIDPNDKGAASFELGQAYYSKNDFVKAIDSFERVRSAGPRAGVLLEADILKYRHGTLGFRSLNSMQTMLGLLLDCYKKTGNPQKAKEVQEQYDYYKYKRSKVLF